MIEKKYINTVPSALKSNYLAAISAIEKNNYEYAVMLLKGVIQKEPGFVDARNQLRKIEKKMTDEASLFTKILSHVKTSTSISTGKALFAAKKYLEAMRKAEDALAISLSSLPALMLLADSAVQLDAMFIAIEALEIARSYAPKNIQVLDKLANAYAMDKQGTSALRIRQEIANLQPGNLQAQQKVREAAAVTIEQSDRIVRNIDDVKDLIEAYEQKRKDGKDNLDLRKKLAELYQKADMHDKALEYLEMVVQEMGAMDPFIDRMMEKSKVAKFDIAIQEWEDYATANPDKNEEAKKNISEILSQKYALRLQCAVDRVTSYPNDLQLRYELACVYWDGGEVDNALQQFQLSQKNPQRRLISFVYLGRCFAEKKQYDIAIEQFEKAISEMIAMDNNKLDALYYLGLTYDAVNKKEKALDAFKKIYQANIKYRDVAERINKAYK